MTTKRHSTVAAMGLEIRTILAGDGKDYLSLTDIAKYQNPKDPRFIIQNWMRTRNTVHYLGLWEELHNPHFNRVEFEAVKKEVGLNSFVMTPQKWIEATNAIGIQSKAGRYGGTYAHSDIAFKFAAWLSPEFELYIIKDYQRLKKEEGERLSVGWEARRTLARTNYRIHTDAIKEHLLDESVSVAHQRMIYASEADIINVALFGCTAKEWRDAHPEARGNIRDMASVVELIILANLESMNAEYIKQGMPQAERLQALRNIARYQLKSVTSAPSTKRLEASMNPPTLPPAKH
jgi:hypothetical protein